jgi:anaerobic ribonucleoside-triphosphate reductase
MDELETETEMKPKTLKIPVLTYSRVVGYFAPVNNWNPGKQQEFEDRKVYKAPVL